MSLLRLVVVSVLSSIAGSGASTTPLDLGNERLVERAPRVEIGEAVLTIYDESGRVVSVQ